MIKLEKARPDKPKLDRNPVTGREIIYPHCDPRILHAPGECKVCDELPEWQQLRLTWGICFTGYEPEGKELPCPADHARGKSHQNWHGNRPWTRETVA